MSRGRNRRRKRVLVCDVQRPFAGKAEDDSGQSIAERLVAALRSRPPLPEDLLAVDLARVPALPADDPAGPLVWRMLDLATGGGGGVDLLVATRFPSYLARHPNKVVWLLDDPQDFSGGPNSGGHMGPPLQSSLDRPGWDRTGLDRRVLSEARRLFAGSRRTARALQETAGLDAAVLPVPATDAPPESWDETVAELTSTL